MAEITEVFDFDQDGQRTGQSHYVTTFPSNVVPEHYVFAMNQRNSEAESPLGYLDRAAALQLAEQLVDIANDLAKPDRFGVKQRTVLWTEKQRNELYSVGMNDGINSERRMLRSLFGDGLTEAIEHARLTAESLDDLRTWLRTPR